MVREFTETLEGRIRVGCQSRPAGTIRAVHVLFWQPLVMSTGNDLAATNEARVVLRKAAKEFALGGDSPTVLWPLFMGNLTLLCGEDTLEGDYLQLFQAFEAWEVSEGPDRDRAAVAIRNIAATIGDGWDDVIADVRTLSFPFVSPVTTLMERVASEWSHRVAAKRILLSYPPGIGVGFRAAADRLNRHAPEVDMSWVDDVYDVRLLAASRLVVTADKCTDGLARDVLVSMLLQLPFV